MNKPLAFLSYSHFDNEHDGNYLIELVNRLANTIQFVTGTSVSIFYDRKDILWGQQWDKCINESLDTAVFFIPIITPSFFNSEYCRQELEKFLQREKGLVRQDLVLPIYYMDYPTLNEELRRNAKRDPLLDAIAARQYTDWRPLRTKPFDSFEVKTVLERLAKQVRDALDVSTLPYPVLTQEASPRNLLFPGIDETSLDGRSKEVVIVLGQGAEHRRPKHGFPTPGPVSKAHDEIFSMAQKSGLSNDRIHTVLPDRMLPDHLRFVDYRFSLASPAVNPFTRELLDEMAEVSMRKSFIEFLVDGYPSTSVRLRIPRNKLSEQAIQQLDPTTCSSDKECVILLPKYSDNNLEGTDYGIFARSIVKRGLKRQVSVVLAGCKVYGTWAAFHAATDNSHISKALEMLNLESNQLLDCSSFWVVVCGKGENGILESKNIRIVSAGFFVAPQGLVIHSLNAGQNEKVIDLDVRDFQIQEHKFLGLGTAQVENCYQNGRKSKPYPVEFVVKKVGCDSVAILLFFIDGGKIYVGLIETVKPVLYMRSRLPLPKNDMKRYVSFTGIIAGGLENLDGEGNSAINRRAAEEVMQEGGFSIRAEDLIDLGHYFTSPGYAVEKMYVRAYELKEFTHEQIKGDGTSFEEGMQIKFKSIHEVMRMLDDGLIEDAKTEIALRRLCTKLGYIPEIGKWKKDGHL
jgi:hypothetical protein